MASSRTALTEEHDQKNLKQMDKQKSHFRQAQGKKEKSIIETLWQSYKGLWCVWNLKT